MNPQQVAQAALSLLDTASMAPTLANLQAATAIREMLGGIASGALILSKAAAPEPLKE